jgi:hypothetical protein
MRGAGSDLREATATEEVRLNAARSALFTASGSTVEFDGLLRRVVRDIPLPRPLEGAILASNPPVIRGISVNLF